MPLLGRCSRCKAFLCAAILLVLVAIGCTVGLLYKRTNESGSSPAPGPVYSLYLSWNASSVPLVGLAHTADSTNSSMPLLWWASETQLWTYDPAGQMCYSTTDGSQWTTTAVVAAPNLTDTRYSTAAYVNGQAWVVSSDGYVWASANCTYWQNVGTMEWTNTYAFWYDAVLTTLGQHPSAQFWSFVYSGGVTVSLDGSQTECSDWVVLGADVNGTWWTGNFYLLPFVQEDCSVILGSSATYLFMFGGTNAAMYACNMWAIPSSFQQVASNAGSVHASMVPLSVNVSALPMLRDADAEVFLSATATMPGSIGSNPYYSVAVMQGGALLQSFMNRNQPAPFKPRYNQHMVPLLWSGNIAFCGGYTQPYKQGMQYTDVWFGTVQQYPAPTTLPSPSPSPSVTPSATPSACPAGFYGPRCAACPGVFRTGDVPCSDHGTCSGSGTTSGSGECVCFTEWMGEECDVSVPAVAGGAGGGLVLLASVCTLVLCHNQLRRCIRRCCWCFPEGVPDDAQPLVRLSARVTELEEIAVGRVAAARGDTAVQVAGAVYRPPQAVATASRAGAAAAAAGAAAPVAAAVPEPQCGICWDAVPDTVLSCGHMFCAACAAELQHCAMCRQVIRQRIRVFR